MKVIREGVRRGEGDDLRSVPPTYLFDLHNEFIRNSKHYKCYICRKLHEGRRRAPEDEAGPPQKGKGRRACLKRG